MKIKILYEGGQVPTKGHPDDAGFDLYAPSPTAVGPGEWACVPLGVAVELPPRTVGLIKDRSSLALRGVHIFGGVVDAGYRGEVKIILMNFGSSWVRFLPGDRVAQMVILPLGDTVAELSDVLSPSAREGKGFGSTGE